MAVAQIGDPAAADLPNRGEGFGHPVAAQSGVNPVADTLQRCAVVRRAQEDDVFQLATPSHAGLFGHMAGAAADQPAHAVDQQRQILNGLRPGFEQVIEQTSKLLAAD